MFWPEHMLLDGCFSFKMEDLVFIWFCPDGLYKSYKYREQFSLKNSHKKKHLGKALQHFSVIRDDANIYVYHLMCKTELLVSTPKEWPHKYLKTNLFGQNLH